MDLLPIRITDGKDPDSGEPCKVLEINGIVVPFWLSPENMSQIQKIAGSKDAIFTKLMNSFLTVVEKCINRKMTMSELMFCVEQKFILPGPEKQ